MPHFQPATRLRTTWGIGGEASNPASLLPWFGRLLLCSANWIAAVAFLGPHPFTGRRSPLTVSESTDSVRSFNRTGAIFRVRLAAELARQLVLFCTLPFCSTHPSRASSPLSDTTTPLLRFRISCFLPSCTGLLRLTLSTYLQGTVVAALCFSFPHCPVEGIVPSWSCLERLLSVAPTSNYTPSPPR